MKFLGSRGHVCIHANEQTKDRELARIDFCGFGDDFWLSAYATFTQLELSVQYMYSLSQLYISLKAGLIFSFTLSLQEEVEPCHFSAYFILSGKSLHRLGSHRFRESLEASRMF